MTDPLIHAPAPPPPPQTAPAPPKGFMAWVRRHKVWSAVIAVLVVWAAVYNLSGHGFGAGLKSHPASASADSSAPADSNGGPSAFIPNLVKLDPSALEDQPAEIWVDETKGVCDDFSGASNSGYPVGYNEVEGQYVAVQRDGMSANDAGFVIAGTSYFCPQFGGGVKAWLNKDTGYVGVATPTTTTTATAPTSNGGNTGNSGASAPAPGSLNAGQPQISAAQVCADLTSGTSATDEVNTISGEAAPGQYVPWGTALEFLEASIASNCPQFQSAIAGIQHG